MKPEKERKKIKPVALLIIIFAVYSYAGDTYCWIRYNQAGYLPYSPKNMIVMSEKDLEGTSWKIFNDSNQAVLTGSLGKSVCGISPHTPKPFNYEIIFSGLTAAGNYRLELDNKDIKPVEFRVDKAAYHFIIPEITRFLRAARSGTADTLFHEASHLGDGRAILYRPKDGKPETGLWEKVPGNRTFDMRGGWYDAGDYIKFTLTIAAATYFLLRAYEINPALFTKKYSRSDLIDVLDEAKFGLDYLVKTFPGKEDFIIQVSGHLDHEIGWRLPENDTRDGQREAFSAISPVHMGLTSAALALGARLFDKTGYKTEANLYKKKAIAIFQRALQPDALKTGAFEFDPSGGFSFYRDTSNEDNMILGAVELYRLTNDSFYIKTAKKYAGKPGMKVYWGSLFLFANMALGKYDADSQKNAESEIASYISDAKSNIWGVPSQYSWGSLADWTTTGGGLGLYYLETKGQDAEVKKMMIDIVDYIFGKNNWGVSFFFCRDLPNSVRHIYSQLYQIKNVFPTGALSEGPAGREVHDRNLSFFKFKPENEWTYEFNTAKAVFYDQGTDFVTQESTIFGQASVLLFLTTLHGSEQLPGEGRQNPGKRT
jgi:endoglucanase